MRRFLFLPIVFFCVAASAQVADSRVIPISGTLNALRQMASGAAVIFQGDVVSIRRQMASTDDVVPELVEIDFHIYEAVRGCQPGSIYTVREWGGLWTAGDRYEVGQRRMMLLHAPGPGGLSSPIMGMDGALPVTSNSVDLRWVQRQALQAPAPLTDQPVKLLPLLPVRPRPILEFPSRLLDRREIESNAVSPTPRSFPGSVVSLDAAPVSEILGLLRGLVGTYAR